MKKKSHDRIAFKPYTQDQLQLPMDLSCWIPEGHMVRVINEMIEEMEMESLLRQYKGGGTSSYHPKMMLKVLVYAYSQRMYSSRQIAKALRENIHFMWLSGDNKPDFRTINRFRGEVLKDVMEEVFGTVVAILIEKGYVKMKHYFVDGTTMESRANRYRWVWAKNTRRYKEGVEKKIKEIMEEVDRVNEAEDEQYGDDDLDGEGGEPIDSEELKRRMEELNERLRNQPDDKKLAKAVRQLERDCLPRLEKYEEQERILSGRNSYAKTDEEATFMRLKGDRRKEARPRPAYNVQIGTENQFVVSFSIHQNPADSTCLIPHLERVKKQQGQLPQKVVGDAGYGSEENYEYLDKEDVDNFMKYSYFDQEQKRSYRPNPYWGENMTYDETCDEFICPEGRRLRYQTTKTSTTSTGYASRSRLYECEDCTHCSRREECTKGKGNRRIHISFQRIEYRRQARDNLLSPEGQCLRAKRGVDVESVFGRLKGNWGFRRFLLTGLKKVEVEWGLLCLAHNMSKVATS